LREILLFEKAMTRNSELLAAFDDAWGHKWESVSYELNGITEDEAIFRHPAYAEIPLEDGHPPAGTIIWHLVHLAHCYLNYTARVAMRPAEPAELPPPKYASLADAIQNLLAARGAFRETIAALSEDELDELLYYDKPVIDLARSTVRHDVWHAGQIAVARRLYWHEKTHS
jgi:uncharacterized damage-inducible protein DinB